MARKEARPKGKPKEPAANGLTYTVEQAGKLLGLSRQSAYVAVRNHEIPVVKIGSRLLVPRVALMRMLESARAAAE